MQTESVAYVASRSENLSVMLYYAAFAVFLYRPGASMTWLRALAIVVLFGAAISTKEHALTLPVLLIAADFFWNRGGIRANGCGQALDELDDELGHVIGRRGFAREKEGPRRPHRLESKARLRRCRAGSSAAVRRAS